MIHRTLAAGQLKSWQEELSSLIQCPKVLLQRLELGLERLPEAEQAAALFPLRVTESFVRRMQPGNWRDPLLRQVLPLGVETQLHPDYTQDPLGELAKNAVPGVVHKYHGRVLLIAATHCAIHCRYCFRRHFPYHANQLSREQWQQALDYVKADTSLTEVILSGGDPLAQSDKQLDWLLQQLEAIPHLQRLRIHSRLPVVLPSRITAELVQRLSQGRLQPVMVMHCNHPQEIDAEVKQALQCLKTAGVTLLNQSVLLQGVNDDLTTLTQLSEHLFAAGALPYYVHLLDKVQGAAHFAVDTGVAQQLQEGLRRLLPGYLVPKFVREIAGEASKTPFCGI